jgi:hypothetical protein
MATQVLATQPVLIPELVDGDLCDIVIGRRYCGAEAAAAAFDADGSMRILCADHRDRYFPGSAR